MPELDSRYLELVQVNYAEPVSNDVCGDEGDILPSAVPLQRAATMNDVLSWADCGDHISIITSDGQQHDLAVLPPEEPPADPPEG